MNSEGYEIIKRLENLLKKMNIPFNRKHINLNNLKWLQKNLKSKNSDNPNLDETMILIRKSIDNKYYTS